MGFLPYKMRTGDLIPWEYLPCAAITPKVGMAMVQNATSGNLEIAKGTTAPTYICMAEYENKVAAGDIVPVIRVDKETIYKVGNSAAMSAVKHGQKVALHASDGLQVTATTEGGVAEVMDYDDAAAAGAGGTVLVRF